MPAHNAKLLISSVLAQAVNDTKAGCHDAREWVSSDKAIAWADYLGLDESRWLSEVRKIKPTPKPPKPPKHKPTACLPDTPLIRALVKLAGNG